MAIWPPSSDERGGPFWLHRVREGASAKINEKVNLTVLALVRLLESRGETLHKDRYQLRRTEFVSVQVVSEWPMAGATFAA